MTTLANSDAALQVACDRAQVLDERLLLVLDHRDQPIVISLAAAWEARW